jgi:hypothetical protein
MPPKKGVFTKHSTRKRRHSQDSSDTEGRSKVMKKRDQSCPADTRPSVLEITQLRQLRSQLAKTQVEHKTKIAQLTRERDQARQNYQRLQQSEHNSRPQRRATRAEEQVEQEAQVNLVLRYQELLSWSTMRRIRQACARARDRVHSTGSGLSTHEDVGIAQRTAMEEVWSRGVRPISDLTSVPSDEGYYQDPFLVIKQFVELHIELHQAGSLKLPDSVFDDEVPILLFQRPHCFLKLTYTAMYLTFFETEICTCNVR